MALVESFEFVLSVLESGILEDVVIEAQASPEIFMAMESGESIKNAITQQIDSWKITVKQQLLNEPINHNLESEIAFYSEVNQYSSDQFLDEFDNIIAKIDINSPFHQQSLTLQDAQKSKANPFFKHYFCDQWQQALFDDIKEQLIEKLDDEKEKLLDDLYQRIDTISQLSDIEQEITEQKKMRLWDMAKAKLSTVDVSSLSKIANYLRNNSELQEIAEKLGRMANEVDSNDSTDVEMEDVIVTEKVTNEVAEDIVGIHEGDELERLLPAEMLYLAYPELEVIFYKHLADKRLATYQQQGKTRTVDKVVTYKRQEKQADIPKGPFIIAVDASGSMMGLPEQAAKGLAYGLMQIALAANRACYVIIFSATQITYELTHADGLSEILSFLSYTFNGGTDLTPVLENAIEQMNSEKYSNADLIVISDFISPLQAQSMLDKITDIKGNQNRFHAVSLSKHGNPELLAIFDYYWEFYPSHLGNFKKLLKKC